METCQGKTDIYIWCILIEFLGFVVIFLTGIQFKNQNTKHKSETAAEGKNNNNHIYASCNSQP